MKRECNRLYCSSSQHVELLQTPTQERKQPAALSVCKNTLIKHAAGLWSNYTHVHTHTFCVIPTWKSWWKTPVFVLEPPWLPCLQGDVTQRGEMNWVNPTHQVGLTKQRQAEWWFIVATVWPSSHMISKEPEFFFERPVKGLWYTLSTLWDHCCSKNVSGETCNCPSIHYISSIYRSMNV